MAGLHALIESREKHAVADLSKAYTRKCGRNVGTAGTFPGFRIKYGNVPSAPKSSPKPSIGWSQERRIK